MQIISLLPLHFILNSRKLLDSLQPVRETKHTTCFDRCDTFYTVGDGCEWEWYLDQFKREHLKWMYMACHKATRPPSLMPGITGRTVAISFMLGPNQLSCVIQSEQLDSSCLKGLATKDFLREFMDVRQWLCLLTSQLKWYIKSIFQ